MRASVLLWICLIEVVVWGCRDESHKKGLSVDSDPWSVNGSDDSSGDMDSDADSDTDTDGDVDSEATLEPCAFDCVTDWWDCSLHDGEIMEEMACEAEAVCCFYSEGLDSETVIEIDTDFESGALVSGLDIVKIAVYQSTEIILMEDGAAPETRYANVVANKDALVRVFVAPEDDWVERPVEARLLLEGSGVDEGSFLSSERTITGPSRAVSMSSTFTFEIPAEQVTEDLIFSVSLRELVGTGPGTTEGARWPESGAKSMDVVVSVPLDIVVVPIAYLADGTGRLPDTSDDTLETIRELFHATYPVAYDDINLRVAEAMGWEWDVLADGDGWSELLAAFAYWREDQGASSKEYYYGLLAPDISLMGYCGVACVSGMGYVPDFVGQGIAKAAVGLGFDGDSAAVTMIHEVGHNHGLSHSPCGAGIEGVDRAFPYDGGGIGVWGYDVYSGALKDPAVETDFMGYCEPQWVSDYTYGAIQQWMRSNNALARRVSVAADWQVLRIDRNGDVFVERVLTLDAPPGGRPREVALYDSELQLVEVVTGYFLRHEPLPGGLLFFLSPSDAVRFVSVEGSDPLPL